MPKSVNENAITEGNGENAQAPIARQAIRRPPRLRAAAPLCYSQIAAAYASPHCPWRGFPGIGRLGLPACPGAFQGIPRAGVRELPHPHGLEPEDRVDPRTAALPGYLWLSVRRPAHAGREAVSWLLDDGLSALRPPSDGGHTPADPHRDTLSRAG